LIQVVWGGRMSAAARHLMWTFIIGGLLLLPAVSFIVPSWTAFTASVPETPSTTPATTPNRAPVVSRPLTLVTSSNTPPSQYAKLPVLPAGVPWATLLTAIYAGGVLLLWGRLVFDRVSTRRLVQTASMT